MVDNDVFRRCIEKGFQSASRAVFDRTDKERAIHLALGAASKALRADGCSGIDQIHSAVVDALEGPATPVALQQSGRLLDVIARLHANDRTLRAVGVAKTLLRERLQSPRIAHSIDEPATGVEFAERFVVAFTEAKLFAGPLLQLIVESGTESFTSFESRRIEFLLELRNASG